LEIAILAVFFYYLILLFRGTRGVQVLTGFILMVLTLLGLTYFLHLNTLYWLLQRFSVYLSVALIVIFQPEIRRVLAELGKQHVFSAAATPDGRNVIEAVTRAALLLSERKIGALIAIEREIGTRNIVETGTRLDAAVTSELLASLFFPHTPLHDGGVILRDGRVAAAGCVFPLSHQEALSKTLGTRHRAAIGITEETDAVVVVVSEETGTISVAFNGRLSRGLEEEKLRRTLHSMLHRERRPSGRLRRLRRRLDRAQKALARPEPAGATGDETGQENGYGDGVGT